MKILLISGDSGTGKSTIQDFLAKNRSLYNPVMSYTDRPMREDSEYGHIFISEEQMDTILQNENVVAETYIAGHRYCTVESQFDVHKVNIYIVDANGIYDTREFFRDAETLSVLLHRDDVDIDSERYLRNIELPTEPNVDFHIYNNEDIYSATKKVDLVSRLFFFNGDTKNIEELILNCLLIKEILKESDANV